MARSDGTIIKGNLEAITESWQVKFRADQSITAAADQWLSLRRADWPRPPMPAREQIVFTNGDRIPGTVVQVRGDRLRFRPTAAQETELMVPLSTLAVIWIAAPDHEDDPDALLHRLRAGKRRDDVVYLRNSDTLEGLLNRLDREKNVRIIVSKKEVSAPFDKVAAVALNTELGRSARPRGVYARLALRDGTRLSLSAARLENQHLIGRTMFAASVKVALPDVAALDLYQGQATFLSDLKPNRYEAPPFLGVRWNYMLDSSVRVRGTAPADLRLGGETYEKGIGMHAPSRLAFELSGAYRRFEARVGLDEKSGRLGSVRLSVVIDGEVNPVNDGREISAATPPCEIRLDVTRAKSLTLVVEPARFGDVCANVDWVDARVVK